MFSGIVEAVGRIRTVEPGEGRRTLVVEAPEIARELRPGDSVALDGACHTVVEALDDAFTVHSIGTTLSRTVAAGYRPGSLVNLERALRVGDRLDGHWVQGHVDGVGEVADIRAEGDFHLLDVTLPEVVERVTVLHGSITVNGVSLTVNALPGPGRAQVALIPFTWTHTNLHALRVGDPVNLEGDLIGKYVLKGLTRGA
ncbi:MAG: riboflavin synthase [Gemmatimonadetes bacterium]|nr:MAG: riboflavin synthase [Gemmatimonadota bacterium]